MRPWTVEVYYDGDCPLCMREIRMLMRRDTRGRIRFTNIAAEGFDAAAVGLDRATLMGKIHGRLPSGEIIEGVEVFRQLYAAVGFERLVAASLYLRLVQAIARARAHPANATRVRNFVSAADAYRSDAMTTDEALEVLEDPTALEDLRVAAATWLAHAPDRDVALPRLRAILDETASARVRAALEPLTRA
jgi:predicted DCC family thiol-disulfide oxidoreductase YuxK